MRIEYIDSAGNAQYDISASEFNLLLQADALIYNKSQAWFEVTHTIITGYQAGGYISITD